MLELTGDMSTSELTRRLFIEKSLFIKDLSGKMGNTSRKYIRVAVRDTKDNDRLVKALKEIL